MEQDKDVYSGFLLLPPQGKIVLRKAWHQKYCLLYKMSKFGIERLEIYDNPDDVLKSAVSRIITLESCIKITAKHPNMFTVLTKTTQYDFATLSEHDLNEWVTAFQSVAFKDDASKITSIEEDNDLYCSSGEGIFSVTLCPSDASKRCGLEAKDYTLVLTSTTIQLRNSDDNKILYTWPYCFIRRYGYRSGKFTFEAGRKCDTGEGTFHLEHSNQQQIFRCLSSKMKSMKKILSGESTNTTLFDCGDNLFHAALSMEARSRSPLPPSPTSSARVHDVEVTNSISSLSSKSLSSLTDSSEKTIARGPLPKPRPAKPPRKNLPNQNKNQTYEPITITTNTNNDNKTSKYDQIEYRQEAWRTLGVDEIKHTETVTDNEELPEYTSWSRVKPQEKNTNPKIISNTPNIDDESYNKLQFFGSTSKLAPGYKQVAGPVPIQSAASTPSWNDYDEVETNMQAVRLADDSHLGYGVIRKTVQIQSQPANNNSEPLMKITHKLYNDAAYAVVSKPKRV